MTNQNTIDGISNKDASPRPINEEQQNNNFEHEEELLKWQASEFESQERNRNWYIVAGAAGLILAGVGIFTQNYLLIIIVLLFGFILFMFGRQQPATIDISLTTRGIHIGSNFHPYKTLEKFWIIYDPPVKTLNFKSTKNFFSEISLQINNQNPDQIRGILAHYIAEDLEVKEESTADKFVRLLKI
jgi:hypothetical protein